MKRSMLNRFAILVSVCTLLLIVAGAMVTSTGSGLSVPDWPLSFGKFFPPMEGGVFFEHGHRMVAGVIGILTLALTLWTMVKETRTWMKGLAAAALVAVVAQAVLGGLTVLYGLPPIISVSHAVLAQTFFCITVGLALFTSPEWNSERADPVPEGIGTLFSFSIAAAALVYLQLILGAVLRHGGSRLFLNFHLAGAALAAVGIIVAASFALRHFSRLAPVRTLGRLLLAGLTIQLCLGLSAFLPLMGIFPVLMRARIPVVTAHVAVGAFLLATSFLLSLWSWRFHACAGQSASHDPLRSHPGDARPA